MSFNYSDRVKFLMGNYQDMIGNFVYETNGCYMISVDNPLVIVCVNKFNAQNVIVKV